MTGVIAPCLPDGDEERPFLDRCDTCQVYPDDEAAAKALAERFGLVVHRRYDTLARDTWHVFVSRPGDQIDFDYVDTQEEDE